MKKFLKDSTLKDKATFAMWTILSVLAAMCSGMILIMITNGNTDFAMISSFILLTVGAVYFNIRSILLITGEAKEKAVKYAEETRLKIKNELKAAQKREKNGELYGKEKSR